MILSFRTDRSGQTVQTQIRLLLEQQSDQGITVCCIPFASFRKKYPKVCPLCLNFRLIPKISGIRKFRNFTVDTATSIACMNNSPCNNFYQLQFHQFFLINAKNCSFVKKKLSALLYCNQGSTLRKHAYMLYTAFLQL